MKLGLGELAQRVGARLVGDPEVAITAIATLSRAGAGDITFLSNSRYRRLLQDTRASAVILAEDELGACPTNALVSDNPYLTYAQTAALFAPVPDATPGVHPTAVVDPSAVLGAGVAVAPHCFIGPGVHIGDGTLIGPGCVLERDVRIGAQGRLVGNVMVYHGCELGDRVLVHAGAVIGADGFGFAHAQGSWIKVAQLGRVIIGHDVEIGANTTIDRGAIEDTVIADGVKLDNQIQVAHNVRIGAHTAVAGCVGIAGSATIGSHCAIGGGAGILGHLELTDGVTVTAMSLVTKSIREPGVYSSGTPLEPSDAWHKNAVRFKHLDEMARRLKQLEKDLEDLKKSG